jgi:hypothetical protein
VGRKEIRRRINRTVGITGRGRRVNAGRAAVGKQSGFGTRSQKRADLVAAFGGD